MIIIITKFVWKITVKITIIKCYHKPKVINTLNDKLRSGYSHNYIHMLQDVIGQEPSKKIKRYKY